MCAVGRSRYPRHDDRLGKERASVDCRKVVMVAGDQVEELQARVASSDSAECNFQPSA